MNPETFVDLVLRPVDNLMMLKNNGLMLMSGSATSELDQLDPPILCKKLLCKLNKHFHLMLLFYYLSKGL